MSRRDKHHDKVKQALMREGWTITHDPYFFQTDPKLATDLGAERLLAAERRHERIAVEIKSFLRSSQVVDLEEARGGTTSMETPINFYKHCVKQLLSDYERLETGSCAAELIFDDERGRYMVIWLGWQGQKRIHSCSVHIDILDENIVIQWNDTEELLDEILVVMGVPRSAIVIGTIPPELRETIKGSLSYPEAA